MINGITSAAGYKNDPKIPEALTSIARGIVTDANQTSAKVGITYAVHEDADGPFAWIGWSRRGAAALPVEVGTRATPARRLVKRALDKRRTS